MQAPVRLYDFVYFLARDSDGGLLCGVFGCRSSGSRFSIVDLLQHVISNQYVVKGLSCSTLDLTLAHLGGLLDQVRSKMHSQS